MRIAICVKQVPAAAVVKLDEASKTLKRGTTKGIINECDLYALELALRMKEKHGGTITMFTMGPPQAKSVLKEGFSLGADRGYLLCDNAFAGSDTYATAHILSCAIRKEEQLSGEFDIILCGKNSSDGDTAQVGAEIAEQLDIPQITAVCDMPEITSDGLIATQDAGETFRRYKASLPVLLTVQKTSYDPRYATISGVIAANHTDQIKTISINDLPDVDRQLIGLDGSPTVTVSTYALKKRTNVTFINGDTVNEKASSLSKLFFQSGLI